MENKKTEIRHILRRKNMTVQQTNYLLAALSNISLNTYPVEQVKEHLRQFRSYPLNVTEFGTGNVVYRIRPNEGNQSFNSITDLSFKPQQFNTTFQRASSPAKTMFYGSIIPQENLDFEVNLARVIAATEGIQLIRNNDCSHGTALVTFGKWRIIGKISLGTVAYSDIERNVTPYAKGRAKYLLDLLNQSPEKAEQGKLLMDFIAEQFSKNEITGDYDYIISALFTEIIVHHGFDGVIYPSVRAEEKGMNVAISPEAVNSNMRLEGAMECMVRKEGDKIEIVDSKVAWVNAGDQSLDFISVEKDLQRRGKTENDILL